jgi:hypothetical protein
LSETLTRWDQQVQEFEAALDSFRPDDPARIAEARQRWSAMQRLGTWLRQATAVPDRAAAPNPMTAPLGTADEWQLETTKRELAVLDQRAHEAAVAELVDKHPELRTPSDQSPPEELVREYERALATQRWRQPERAGHEKLIGDLQAPVSESEARRCRRQGDDVRAFIEAIRHPGGKVSRRRRWDWLQDSLARRGFGGRFGQSLPKLDRWMQQHLAALSLLALRKGRTSLRERIELMSSLPPLTPLTFRDAEAHLAVVAQVYEEATEAPLEAARHHDHALQRAQQATSAEGKTRDPPCLLAQGYDFRSSFPFQLRGTFEDNPDPSIEDATWIAALHEAWVSDLQRAQREIRSSNDTIEHPVNPKTGRKLRKLSSPLEHHYRDRLNSAKRTIERILVDYRGRFGIQAARRFSDHLEWLHVPAVRDLAMNALTPEGATERARVMEWADRYIQMWLYQPHLSPDSSPEAKAGRPVATDSNAGLLQRVYDEARTEQAHAEREYGKKHGVQALGHVLQQVRDGLGLRGCKVLPDLPTREPTLQAASGELHGLKAQTPSTTLVTPDSHTNARQRESKKSAKSRAARVARPSPPGAPQAVEQHAAWVDTSGPLSVAGRTAVSRDTAACELSWNSAMPAREGLSQYTLLIRAPGDERFEKRQRGSKAGGQLAWRDDMSPATVGPQLQSARIGGFTREVYRGHCCGQGAGDRALDPVAQG